MKKTNKLGIVFILIILALLFIKDVNALGISPGRKVIDFEPKLRREVLLSVTNPEHKEFMAVILARGELGKYIELPQNSIEFSSVDGEKIISYEIFLPQNIEGPGIHEGEVVVREIPISKEEEEILVDALVAVVHQVHVRVPYPGKYAEAEFEIVSGNKGEDVKFFLRVSNLGKEDIDRAKAFIYIYDNNNNLVSVVKTDEKDIKIRQRKELVSTWNANISLGSYRATAILDYDGVISTLENTFLVGDFFIKPLDLSVAEKFSLGEVAKFNILVENLANEKVNGLIAEMILFNEEGNSIANLKSNPYDVMNKSKQELTVFWYTEGISEGTYLGKLILSYGGKSLDRKIKVIVNADSIQAEIIGVTGLIVSTQIETETPTSKFPIYTIIIIVLILSNIAWLIYFKKFRK